ncbi:endonuclease domain-containing protein [Asanoa sp. WMMD1127]|nr:endonuclease domain-containing protein [Asanoa sp. WMMD1127]MDG4820339.1 endonuclease domain-containing protein [Asanoa sp. WMMD1127]
MAVLLAANFNRRHDLSEIDTVKLTAVCAACGPVRIRKRTERRVHATRPSWRCRTAERAREWARLYGLTVDAVLDLLGEQQGCCAICNRRFDDDYHVDHDHDDGRVRGLLCTRCNTGLGLLGDSADRLLAAAAYLRRGA